MFYTLALIAAVIGLAIYVFLTWNFNYWKKKGVPGPKPIPLFGAFPDASMQKKNLIYEIDEVYKTFRHSTPFVGYFSGRSPAMLVIDPAVAKNVLIGNFASFHDNEFSSTMDKETDPIFARNPFALSGDEWKEKRAEITPAFTNSRIKSMYPIVTDVCKKMNKFLIRELGKGSPNGIDVKELGAKYTVDVVASCIYGVDSQAFTHDTSIIREMGRKLVQFPPILLIYFTVVQIFPAIAKYWKMKIIPKNIEVFFTQLMQDAVKLRNESKLEHDDYLNYLLQLQKKKNLQHIDLAAHTLTFFLDGFETSSGVIALLLYRLGKHANIQEKLRSEIRESLKKNNGEVTFEGIAEMQYLDMVFNESMRMDPILGVLSRRCTETITFNDYKNHRVAIEMGTVVTIPIYSLQRDPDHYVNPNVFNPDRFHEDNGGLKKYKEKGVFLGFGDGPRICLGMRFATVQVKAAIIEIIRNFEVTVNKKTQEPFVYDPKNFLLLPIGGIWLDFTAI